MSDDSIIGECGHCHETKELVAEMEISMTASGTDLGPFTTIQLCKECIPKATEAFTQSTGQAVEFENEF